MSKFKAPAKRVMSLKEPTLKMSKSHADPRSRILLSDSSEEIFQKIKSALTDSEPDIYYDPIKRPGVSNLIEILAHVSEEEVGYQELATRYKSTSMQSFKEHISSQISQRLTGIRERYLELMATKTEHLDSVAEAGAATARRSAATSMDSVRHAMGL